MKLERNKISMKTEIETMSTAELEDLYYSEEFSMLPKHIQEKVRKELETVWREFDIDEY